ncbi:CSS-motif domain-containing protein [Pseudomonas sp. R5(2019)]|uniref:CSS-motif domain-containing protein n=1 Tax=Pseudomonas sp. R5(2019) TaxID=2697566 RepID=UPI001411DAAD|nr:CSS-motif domain-containing protein [Pseudomonas sp. R5(2019)]NBA96306.1 hypothetical protein [Pseudomonas sp. R5(2019)]
MTPLRTSVRDKRKLLFVSIAVGLTPIVAGLLVLYTQVDRSLAQSATKATIMGLHKTEAVMDRVSAAAGKIRYLAGQPCDAALSTLRMGVVSETYLRSLTLVRNNRMYCSSLEGVMSAPLDPANFHDGKFWLRQGNPTTPDSSMLYYRLYSDPQGIAAIVDGQTLLDALDIRGDETPLILEMGAAWLDRLGNVRTEDIPENPEHHVKQTSRRYGYCA